MGSRRCPLGVLSARSLGLESALAAGADRYWFYGPGKAALRDGLAPLVTADENVLLPACLPDAVTEPIVDLDCEPWWYAITPTVTPDLVDLEARTDDRTEAVISIDYSGFSQAAFADVDRVAR